jgi:hypothetical protein
MDLYFRGRASLHQWLKLSTLEYLTQARRFFEQAVVLDPKNFYAIFGVAAVDVQIAEGYYSEDPVARLVVAEEMMVKALPHVLNGCACASGIWPTANSNQPRGLRDSRVRASVGLGSQFGWGACDDRQS